MIDFLFYCCEIGLMDGHLMHRRLNTFHEPALWRATMHSRRSERETFDFPEATTP